MTDALRLAVGTLTAVPVPPPTSLAAPVPGRAMALAPAAGLIPGAIAGVSAWLALAVGLSAPVAAVIVVGAFALSTRGLHLDGLADTADGLAASYDRVKALTVMRRGDTGPSGLATVVLVLLLQCAALSQVLQAAADAAPSGGLGAGPGVVAVVLLVAVAARVAVPLACLRPVPSARPDGLGATVAGSVSPGRSAVVLIAAAVAGSAAAAIGPTPWWSGALAVAAVVAVTGLLLLRAIRRLGGMTGDVIGAGVEIGATAALLVLAAST